MDNIIIFAYYIIVILKLVNNSPVCRAPDGKEVDWYSILFFPTGASSDGKIHYGYYDNTMLAYTYREYEESKFPPTHITKYAIGDPEGVNYFFWNDDMTCKDDTESHSAPSSRAHSKGSLVFDKEKGVFLLHSLPRFPTRLRKGNELLTELPSNAGIYGQTFLCISVNKNQAVKIAEYLNYINVQINKSVDKDKVADDEWVKKLIENKFDSKYPSSGVYEVYSLEGNKFDFISKGPKNNDIPFDKTIRQMYNSDFYVRTWTRPAPSESLCDKYFLKNVWDVEFNGEFSFGRNNEHSKWAVAVSNGKKTVCFSDLNHCDSQMKRGGHIVCFMHPIIQKELSLAIISHDECSEEEEILNKYKFLE